MLTPFIKPCAILNLAAQNAFTHNPPYIQSGSCLLIGFAKSYNYKYKMSKN